MANLAIKGHATRGNEVIEILEMLGGINKHNYHTDSFSLCHLCFCIAKNTNIIYFDWVRDCCEDEDMLVFALEEFLEKYPYKVGDKVIAYAEGCLAQFTIQGIRWNDELNKIEYRICSSWYDASLMYLYKESPMYLNEKANKQTEEIKKILEPMKEMMEERKYSELRTPLDDDDKLATEATIDGNKITPPENYLIGKVTKVNNGMLVEFVKKKPQYPKTYEECCGILNTPIDNFISKGAGYKAGLLSIFQQLLICRDAYWKMAGEQMGLGEPWKPTDDETSHLKYVIQTIRCEITCLDTWCKTKNILELPTAEMRDIFYENFKNLIENCKELL